MKHYSGLEIRQIFHIEFLRAFSRKFKPQLYALKGGVNLRLFFKSIRYSEDMDMDVKNIDKITLRDSVMKIIASAQLRNELRPFGIRDIRVPDMAKAKQTDTTQRFKVHLLTDSNEDLFSKIEFSRRGMSGGRAVEHVPEGILREYRVSPFLTSHYDAETAVRQKIGALADRSVVQARDIFDLHVLSTQCANSAGAVKAPESTVKKACENLFSVEFRQFRDTVLAYLEPEDRAAYDNPGAWDEIKLKVNEMICLRHQ